MRRVVILLAVLANAFVGAKNLHAASTQNSGPNNAPDELLAIGETGPINSGDFISSTGGLNTFYTYYIEVPPGTAFLNVQVFDADTGGTLDKDRGGAGFNNSTTYRLFDPSGTARGTQAIAVSAPNDAAWVNVPANAANGNGMANPPAGHWRLEVDTTVGAGAKDDVNMFGLRAHDGTVGTGGTELNAYYHRWGGHGVNDAGATTVREIDVYPYNTAGCSAFSMDFDWDHVAPGTANQQGGTYQVRSRTGAFVFNPTPSGQGVWAGTQLLNWTTAASAVEYGIWRTRMTIRNSPINDNWTVYMFGNHLTVAPPPNSDVTATQANIQRVYLPREGDLPPLKTFVTQTVAYVSGPNPPIPGFTSTYRVTITVNNPEQFAVTFGGVAANRVRSLIPGGQVLYGGRPGGSPTGGLMQSEPALNGSGNVDWNPQSVPAASTRTLTYDVRILPTAPNALINVTGTDLSSGTTAQFVDLTGDTVNARATYAFGPLCGLQVQGGADCNGNGIPDATDISSGSSLDCEPNGVPDECEAGGNIIIRQLPETVDCAFCADVNALQCGTTAQSMADNFVLGVTRTIERLKVWGFFSADNNPAGRTFDIRYRSNSGSLPGAVVATFTGLTPIVQNTGQLEFGQPMFELTFNFTSPPTLTAGTYWVEVYENTGVSGQSFVWSSGNLDVTNGLIRMGTAYSAPGASWFSSNFNLAMEMNFQRACPNTPNSVSGGATIGGIAPEVTLAPRDTATIHVTVRNQGEYPWSWESGDTLHVVSDPCNIMAVDDIELPVGLTIQPGESYEFELPVAANISPTTCDIVVMMSNPTGGTYGDPITVGVTVAGPNGAGDWHSYD